MKFRLLNHLTTVLKFMWLITIFCFAFDDNAFPKALYAENNKESSSSPIILELPSSFNPVGSGARAMGMGGAFIAVADDATAASWNPGGLIQLEKPELSIVGGYLQRDEEKNQISSLSGSTDDISRDSHLNYLSAVWPFQLFQRNMVLSISYQHLYDFNRQWNATQNIASGIARFDYTQQGSLYALGLSYCSQITGTFSLGLTINRWGDFIYPSQWEQKYDTIAEITVGGQDFVRASQRVEHYDLDGYNVNIGFLWEISPFWKVGGVFKSPFEADIKYKLTDTQTFNTDFELNMPPSFGLGVAWLPFDSLTISGDLFTTQWDEFYFLTHKGTKISPITGKRIEASGIYSSTWFRLGLEYILMLKQNMIPLKAGLFYDPAPAEKSQDNYYGGSIGIGLIYKNLAMDMAYQVRWGNDVAGALPDFADSLDIQEHQIMISCIIYL